MSRRGVTLTTAAREFFRHPSPWVLGVALIASVIARVIAGDWRPSDALLPLLVLAVFPFLEWTMHVVVLHWRPRRIAGVVVDPMLARKHREHHVDPRVVRLIFIPMQSLIGAVVSTLIIGLLVIPRTALGLTFLVTVFAIGVVYEWTHYLVHTDYKPKHVVYRAIWRNHRLHHYKNEHYWFAVTSPGIADRALGTYPDPQSVPTSPTARNLYAEKV
ncbi:MAG TPA: sterol desaturase family protein [Mycobacterium sp.]|uniref:sterol desaturase family protein n=1 Tax=Mycolicibacterium sp. TaxID=2320850 RepID=UPI0025E57474|nr:sterol desaturase family protein [Mycolicibacterium sp.]HPX36850.1 sterol desaturase family protein [Mycobacterium sp.]HQC76230.1 sterol desaturase family protein [Mycobacterium sp.]